MVEALLLQPNIDVNKSDKNFITPLFSAVMHNRIDVVKLLVKRDGIDVNAARSDNMTPFQLASVNEFKEVADLLRSHGGMVNVEKEDNERPLSPLLACRTTAFTSSGTDVNAGQVDNRRLLDGFSDEGKRLMQL